MRREYKTIQNIAGPLILVEGVIGIKNEELVEIYLPSGDTRRGRVVELDHDTALVQVFEGTSGIDVPETKISFRGRGIELSLSDDILGRTFNGLGRPIDGGPAVIPKKKMDINGLPINPYARYYPDEFIQTGISSIDGLNPLVGRSRYTAEKIPKLVYTPIPAQFRAVLKIFI